MPSAAATPKHAARAAQHLEVGEALYAATRNEWAAVCYFYAAYHWVRAAMIRDPIWDDLAALREKSADLLPQDRDTARHQGRRRPGAAKEWGVNEIVSLLYPDITRAYERLHQASVAVRYRDGLPTDALPALRTDAQHIGTTFDAGALVAPSR